VATDPATAPPGRSRPSLRSRLVWLAPPAAFAAVEIYALRTWLRLGRSAWFYQDEWDFLAKRKAGDLGDLFRPHNGHWTTLPILTYRLLYSIFGLRSYFPYRLVVVVLYLIAAALLMVVMRRAGVNPWIAAAAASAYALFGAGWANIVRPFQITFTGSLVFGLLYLLLADHDGAFARRDWFGLLAGAFALMTSGVALVLIAVVGIAVLARRGWRIAVAHMVPMVGVYALWFAVIGRKHPGVKHLSTTGMTAYVVRGLHGGFDAFWPATGWRVPALVLVLAGIALAVYQRRRSGELVRLAAPLALLAGAVLVLVTTVLYGRSLRGSVYALQPRYLSLVGAFIVPALAVAVDAFTRLWRWLVPVGVVLFVAGVPHNIHQADGARGLDRFDAATRTVMTAIPHVPMAREVPRALVPERYEASPVTVGWLLDADAQHRLPPAAAPTPRQLTAYDFRLSFYTERGRPPTSHCRDLRAHKTVWLKKGDVLGVLGWSVRVEPVGPTVGFVSPGVILPSGENSRIVVLRDVPPVRVGDFPKNRRHVLSRICIYDPRTR
jgi:hypothetical protein